MKNKRILFLSALCALMVGIYACKKNVSTSPQETETKSDISANVLAQIKDLGFSTENARVVDGGYLVEGDILLTQANLSEKADNTALSIAETEQYRTTNTVKNLPRVITVSVTNLPTVYSNAVNEMITRYNSLGLRITFQRAAAGTTGNINVIGFNEGPSGGFITLGSAGFPTSSGQPFNQIKMNTNAAAYGSNPNLLYLASVIQHEVGHCIGLRHTDYMNRAFSCGSAGAGNEGQSTVGAIQIPGTPSTPDAASFMLACSNGGNRTFNANDKIALDYLY
ncbi:M57 family metalloprotease [Pedobacter punctiformis]|uniref:M57 family metalloprotease n=1 Tax=Pedobacter punctiformis TaxID=3004097 RepID=A0ABT4LAV1_9SPHI|nr:M57 family metalloprotease [Pedobacter sp. HCMS5-2]MCZ4245033.1 M57 family metalloprotease [Pedobacter sp. HCMS5-2]